MILHLDFETRSHAEIKLVGLYNYVYDKSTEILMLAYAFGEDEVQLWEPHKSEFPSDLRDALMDKSLKKSAWNSGFERGILREKLDIWIDYSEWEDPQPSARYLSTPGSLDEVGTILGLPEHLIKNKDGKRLIDIFSKPTVPRKKKGQELEKSYFRDWITDAEDWQRFAEYCRQDVVAEREISRRLNLLKVFPLPERERKFWVLDQKINDRGIPTDASNFVTKALKLASREKEESIEANNKRTGLENSNSNSQLIEWVGSQGYSRKTLNKDAVTTQLKYNEQLTPLCREVLEARKAASSTSYKKLSAILRQVSSDGRLRNQFVFMGSSRCGRWSSSGGIQFHNMARPIEIFEDEKNIDEARNLIYREDYDGIQKRFGSVLLTVKSNIRTAFVARPGKKFEIADLGAIETRVGAWVSGCQPLLDVFIKGRDPYLDLAAKMSGIPYEKLAADIKSKDPAVKAAAKRLRQIAKSGILGAIYRLSGGDFAENEDGDKIKTGLFGYAEAMGIDMSVEQAHEVVRTFRESYREIVEMWFALEKAVSEVLKEGTIHVRRMLGPNGCVKIDKLIIHQQDMQRSILRIQLPSGRFLHYLDAKIEDTKMPWVKENEEGAIVDVYKPTLIYAGQNQKTKKWGRVTSHGGKIFENLVQSIARDVLAEKLLAFEEVGMPVVAHVHDEGIVEIEDDVFSMGYRDMEEIMSQPVPWSPGLPLSAEGFSSSYYRK